MAIVTSDVRGFSKDYSPKNSELSRWESSYTDTFEGTSSAYPLVASVISLMLTADEEFSAQDVKDILKSTERKIGIEKQKEYNQDGHSIHFGYGYVNALEAVKAVITRKNQS